ncbi:TetR/AcrR family transcriptional regulator [Rhodococcus aetherivorans]
MISTKGGQRQAELLDAAERVLTTRGNADASLRDFAAAAGVRIGHLQHYFPTRADLIRAVLERALQRSLERLSSALGPIEERGEQPALTRSETTSLFEILLAEQDDPSCVRLFVEVWAIAMSDESTAAVVRDFYTGYVGHVADLVACVRPDLDRSRSLAVAATVVSLVEGAAIVHSAVGVGRSAEARSEIIRAAVGLVHGP